MAGKAPGAPRAGDGALVSTGVAGLDDILSGGLPRNRLYLVQGDPGVGKTTLALQFLQEGRRRGERVLYIALSETGAEIGDAARSHGWSLDGIDVYELGSLGDFSQADSTLFHPEEVELHETMRTLLAEVDRVNPARVVFDSLSEVRLLAQSPLRYRRQILALKQYFAGRECTVLLLDDRTGETGAGESHLQSLSHGVISMEQRSPEFGTERRRLRIVKLRGLRFRAGYHDFTIQTGGLQVYPRLVAAEHHRAYPTGELATGIHALDELTGGGLDHGTATLVVGPAGSGKSALATQYAVAAARRGQRIAMFLFDERTPTLFARSRSLGMELERHVNDGTIRVQQIDPAEMSPGEFVGAVRSAVEGGASVVVIDSLNGYLQAMPEERFLNIQMHELLTYLSQSGVTTLMVMAQHGLLGTGMQSPIDMSYLADTVVLLRFFESGGAIRKAISVVKKRSGGHETTIREYRHGPGGVTVGAPLTDFHGVLTGVPTYRGKARELLGDP